MATLRVLLKNFPDRIADFAARANSFRAANPDINFSISYEDSPYEPGDIEYDDDLEEDEQEINPNWLFADVSFKSKKEMKKFETGMGL